MSLQIGHGLGEVILEGLKLLYLAVFHSISALVLKASQDKRELCLKGPQEHPIVGNKSYSQQISGNSQKRLPAPLQLLPPNPQLIKFETLLQELMLSIFLE